MTAKVYELNSREAPPNRRSGVTLEYPLRMTAVLDGNIVTVDGVSLREAVSHSAWRFHKRGCGSINEVYQRMRSSRFLLRPTAEDDFEVMGLRLANRLRDIHIRVSQEGTEFTRALRTEWDLTVDRLKELDLMREGFDYTKNHKRFR